MRIRQLALICFALPFLISGIYALETQELAIVPGLFLARYWVTVFFLC